MTSVLEGADNLVARGSDIGVRVKGLDAAVAAARGRLDDAQLEQAAEVVARAGERLRLSADHTVVALGGATGSGKSSTFNALVGLELASVSVRRPTTSWATACTWGTNGAAELLEWLGIPARHQVVRDSMLDTGREPKDMNGLVLLDLPDHDSTEVSHHLEVDRLVRLADCLVWVLDPQKYADAAIHDGFLRPLAAHKGVMMVVLNHIDEVAEERRAGMIEDLRRLLDADGLEGITLVAISAREGIGVEDLRAAITGRVRDKAATKARIATNLTEVSASLSAVSGEAAPPMLTDADHEDVREAIAKAAGMPVVVDAVQRSSLLRAQQATGWPVTSWLSRFRGDPLKDLDDSARRLISGARTSLPDAHQVQRAQVDTAVRDLADRLSSRLTRPWATALRRAATSRLNELDERLDRAVGSTDLGTAQVPGWARVVQGVQWLLLLAAVAGAAWFGAIKAGVGSVSDPQVGGFSLALAVLIGGVALGILLSAACNATVASAAKRRAGSVDAKLRSVVHQVTDELVVEPLRVELDAYRRTTEGLRAARG